jgi:hypothetical protein
MQKRKGWYATFTFLIVAVFVVIYALTGQDAIGAAARFLSNGAILIRNMIARSAGSLLKLLAQGVGWRRLSRFLAAGASVGLGYAASVVVSDRTVKQARGWREKFHAAVTFAQQTWHKSPLFAKILAVACLIASQIYLHFFLVVFPIAFLVPAVRRIWVRAADMMFGSWYWKSFGKKHRAIVASVKRLPLIRSLFEGARLTRLRYLSAWRLWRYDPRYRDLAGDGRHVSLIEPWRLWRRGELDRYIERPLLAGRMRTSGQIRPESLEMELPR